MERLRQRRAQQRLETSLRQQGVPPLVAYWQARYAAGGSSGAGSAGDIAEQKAAAVNTLIEAEDIRSVVDWGCGDGKQLDLLALPDAYLGVDIAPAAIARCIERHPGRAFLVWPPRGVEVTVRAELALSLDVIFHLVDDRDFDAYWRRLFASATRWVLLHGTNHDRNDGDTARHVRHRRHTPLTPTGWSLVDQPDTPTEPGFYLWKHQ